MGRYGDIAQWRKMGNGVMMLSTFLPMKLLKSEIRAVIISFKYHLVT